jgi:hypothetical protein
MEESKIDKRKQTSKANMEKARLKILEERRKAKEQNIIQPKYEISDSNSDSESSNFS